MTLNRYPWRRLKCLSGGRFSNRKIRGRRFHHQGQPFQQGRNIFEVSTNRGQIVGSKNISLRFSHGQSGIRIPRISPVDQSSFSRRKTSNDICGLWRGSKNATPDVTDTFALSRFVTTKAKTSEGPSRIWSFWRETKNKETLKPLLRQTIFYALLKQQWGKFILPSLAKKIVGEVEIYRCATSTPTSTPTSMSTPTSSLMPTSSSTLPLTSTFFSWTAS